MKKIFVEKAIQLVVMDAIEKGHANPNELAAYMATESFDKQVKNYVEMFEKEF